MALLVLGLAGGSKAARADCAADATTLKAKLAAVANTKRREEAKLLIEKAVIDGQHGRSDLCAAALERAGKLMQ